MYIKQYIISNKVMSTEGIYTVCILKQYIISNMAIYTEGIILYIYIKQYIIYIHID